MVKEKPNSTRLYDSDGFRKRAACVCVKNEQEAEVCDFILLIIMDYTQQKLHLFCVHAGSFGHVIAAH